MHYNRMPFYIVPSNRLVNSLQDVISARNDEILLMEMSVALEDEVRSARRYHTKIVDLTLVSDVEGRIWTISSLST
jgi:hypothetical protein